MSYFSDHTIGFVTHFDIASGGSERMLNGQTIRELRKDTNFTCIVLYFL